MVIYGVKCLCVKIMHVTVSYCWTGHIELNELNMSMVLKVTRSNSFLYEILRLILNVRSFKSFKNKARYHTVPYTDCFFNLNRLYHFYCALNCYNKIALFKKITNSLHILYWSPILTIFIDFLNTII